MDALKAMSPSARASSLHALPRAALQKLAKEAGLRVRSALLCTSVEPPVALSEGATLQLLFRASMTRDSLQMF